MADFTKLNRYRSELKRMREKRAELDNKIKEMERKCREEENTTIHDLVREAGVTPEELAAFLGMNGAEKLAVINGKRKDIETEEDENNEETV